MWRRAPWLVLAALAGACTSPSPPDTPDAGPPDGSVPDGGGSSASVLEHHNGPSRAGLYVEPAFTKAAAATIRRDAAFDGAVTGAVEAQPLFVAGAAAGKADVLLVATTRNEVSALDPATGTAFWRRTLAAPVPRSALPCGNIDPLGIVGTPVADAAARTVWVAAMTTPDGGGTKRHKLFALSVDDGTDRPGFPVDIGSALPGFDSAVQNQRGALLLLGGKVYVPYGAHAGDCGNYNGWVVAVAASNPSGAGAWKTRARGGGIWAPSGLASDGASIFVPTGNTFNATAWSDGEAVLRLAPSLPLATADSYAPSNWAALDAGDTDLGGSGVLLVDAPGVAPGALAVALGKDGKAYLLDRGNLGGVGGHLHVATVASRAIITAPAAFTSASGTYVVFSGGATTGSNCPGDLGALRIGPGPAPAIAGAWCASLRGRGGPIVTTTGGGANGLVWATAGQGDNRLRAFDADTGQTVFGGGGPGDAMGRVSRFMTPIVAGGRIYVGGDGKVYAFGLP